MKQRNWLLKQCALTTIAIWEEQMATAAIYLTCKRAQTIVDLEKMIQSESLGSDQLKFSYRSQALMSAGDGGEALHEFFLKQFEKQRSRECELGITLSGPHRDDLSILLNGKEIRQFASEGQQKSSIASLKLAQWRWLEPLVDQIPALCIDDIGVSFDLSRELEFYKRVQELGQVFITSARPLSLPSHLLEIDNGALLSEGS